MNITDLIHHEQITELRPSFDVTSRVQWNYPGAQLYEHSCRRRRTTSLPYRSRRWRTSSKRRDTHQGTKGAAKERCHTLWTTHHYSSQILVLPSKSAGSEGEQKIQNRALCDGSMDVRRLIHQHEQNITPLESFEAFSWVQRRKHNVDDVPTCRRRRKPTPPLQRQMLESLYKRTRYPSAEMRGRLATIHNTTSRKIQIWFQNRRMKEKNDTSKLRTKALWNWNQETKLKYLKAVMNVKETHKSMPFLSFEAINE
ncbi:homeobox protein MIXL1 [Planoprotostelium fungivorum]|uniref:Homeobox protein MIXL1 n=1 Tax=Planoprotostelium fungivorum TaxID=1890364 RepID=A0A2P6NTZ3_9EUKA|nr:homeobox protein MIXL1 [Planoprotostelium fungivorum]